MCLHDLIRGKLWPNKLFWIVDSYQANTNNTLFLKKILIIHYTHSMLFMLFNTGILS